MTVALRDTSTFRNASLADATLPAQWDNQSPATMRDNVLANLLLRYVFFLLNMLSCLPCVWFLRTMRNTL